jgi:hypothetical protein
MILTHHADRFGGIAFWEWLVPVLLFAALVGLLTYVLLSLARRPGEAVTASAPGRYGPDPAVEQVRFRYARGDLTRGDYVRLMADLGGSPLPPETPPAAPPETPPPTAPTPPPAT